LVIIQDGKILANSSADDLRASQASRHRMSLGSDTGWLRSEPGVTVIDISGPDALVNFDSEATAQLVLSKAMERGTVNEFSIHRPSLADIYREIIR